MYTDYYFNNSTSALMVQVDLVKKCVYLKIAPPKPSTPNVKWPGWNWNEGVLYTVNFEDLVSLVGEINAIVSGKSVPPNTTRSYQNNMKVMAFGVSPNDNVPKLAIQNNENNKTNSMVFAFNNTEDLKKFIYVLNFIVNKQELFFLAEFIINSTYNLLRGEIYKILNPQQQQKTYTKNTGTSQPALSIDEMFGGDNNSPTATVLDAVDNIASSFGKNTPKENSAKSTTTTPRLDVSDLL